MNSHCFFYLECPFRTILVSPFPSCVNSGSYNVMTSQHSSGAEEETAELVEMDELETEMGLLGDDDEDDDATVSD